MMLVSSIAILFVCHAILVSPMPPEDATVPKLFGIDIDGTFYTKNEEAFCENIEAFKRAKEAGYNLFFCTGGLPKRLSHFTRYQFVEKTGYNGYPGVYANGALVLDEKGDIIESNPFPRVFLEKLLQFIQENNYEKQFALFDGKKFLILDTLLPLLDFYNNTDEGQIYETKVATRDEILRQDVFIIYADIDVDIEAFKSYNYEIDIVIIPNRLLHDIMPPGATKASGVVKLCKHFGIEPRDVGFIGDGLNDVEMMKLSDHSYAVGNALPEVKQHAKYVLNETCDEGAFAKAMSLVYDI